MRDLTDVTRHASRREPWNKGKWIGEKPLLRPKHVWSIRTKLQLAGRTCDLAMFNLAIESKLRGCDVVRLRVADVAPHGHAVDRAAVRQKKTPASQVRDDRGSSGRTHCAEPKPPLSTAGPVTCSSTASVGAQEY